MKIKPISISILTATIITISGISALGTISNAIAQEDVGWRTFISPEYKFSIDYPADLEAHDLLSSSKGPEIAFYSLENLGFTSEPSFLYINPNNMSLSEFVNHALGSKMDKEKLFEGPTSITVADGNPGFSFSGIGISSQNISKHVIFTHGDKIYEFVYVVDKEKHNESQYNHMVESIKFLT